MTQPSYDPAPLGFSSPPSVGQAASKPWVERIAQVVNLNQQGKLNATIEITLDAGVGFTLLVDVRISAFSVILFMPLTADAAAELAAGTMYVSDQKSGEATITHANDLSETRTFRALIIG